MMEWRNPRIDSVLPDDRGVKVCARPNTWVFTPLRPLTSWCEDPMKSTTARQ